MFLIDHVPVRSAGFLCVCVCVCVSGWGYVMCVYKWTGALTIASYLHIIERTRPPRLKLLGYKSKYTGIQETCVCNILLPRSGSLYIIVLF